MLEIEIRIQKRGCLAGILSVLSILGIGCYLLFHEGTFSAIFPAAAGGILGTVLIPACIVKFKKLNAKLDNLRRKPWLKSETETPKMRHIEKIYVIGIILGETLLFPIALLPPFSVWGFIPLWGFVVGIGLYLGSILAYYGY